MSASHKERPEDRLTNQRERLVREHIEEAMRPYLGVLPEEALATMREILEDTMATHPVALEALDALEAHPLADRSGTRVREDRRDGADRRDEDDDDVGDGEGVG